MHTRLRAGILAFVLAGAPGAALAFPGGDIFFGKVKCITLYNGGFSAAEDTDVVTLEFLGLVTDSNQQMGTAELSHTNTFSGGLSLAADLEYVALRSEQSDVGQVGIHDPASDDDLQRGGIAEYKVKPGAPIGSLRVVFYAHDTFQGFTQRCSGTLKRIPDAM